LTQVALPFLSDPVATLAVLAQNVLQVQQLQSSDLLPLSQTDAAQVAVLLSVTETAGLERDAAGERPSNSNADGAMVLDERETSHISALDRLLASPEAPLDVLRRNLGKATQPCVTSGSEWVWSARTLEPGESPVLTIDLARPAPAANSLDDADRAAVLDLNVALSDQPAHRIENHEVPLTKANPGNAALRIGRSAPALAALSAVLIGAAIWTGRRKILRACVRSNNAIVGAHFDSIDQPEPAGGTIFLGSRD